MIIIQFCHRCICDNYTSSLAVGHSSSLAVKDSSSLAVSHSSNLAVSRSSSLAVDQLSSLAVDRSKFVAPNPPEVNPVDTGQGSRHLLDEKSHVEIVRFIWPLSNSLRFRFITVYNGNDPWYCYRMRVRSCIGTGSRGYDIQELSEGNGGRKSTVRTRKQ